jgi:YD repeat-containing protein
MYSAVEMTKRHHGAADASQVRITFAYHALGQLLTKTDPQTRVTAANGYRYRARPEASSAPLTLYRGRQITCDAANRLSRIKAAPRPC